MFIVICCLLNEFVYRFIPVLVQKHLFDNIFIFDKCNATDLTIGYYAYDIRIIL